MIPPVWATNAASPASILAVMYGRRASRTHAYSGPSKVHVFSGGSAAAHAAQSKVAQSSSAAPSSPTHVALSASWGVSPSAKNCTATLLLLGKGAGPSKLARLTTPAPAQWVALAVYL